MDTKKPRKTRVKVEIENMEAAEAVRKEVLRRFNYREIVDNGRFIYIINFHGKRVGDEEMAGIVNIFGTAYILRNLVWLVFTQYWPTGHVRLKNDGGGLHISNLELIHPDKYYGPLPPPTKQMEISTPPEKPTPPPREKVAQKDDPRIAALSAELERRIKEVGVLEYRVKHLQDELDHWIRKAREGVR